MRLSQIDDKLTVYKNHKVIIYGAGRAGIKIYNKLHSFGIQVEFFCDKNPQLWNQKIQGVTVISPDELKEIYSDSYLIQIGSTYEFEIKKYLGSIGISNYILFTEADVRLKNLARYQLSHKNPEVFDYYLKNQYSKWGSRTGCEVWDGILTSCFDESKEFVILLQPPKTGDHTMMYTAEKYGIHGVFFRHSAFFLTEELKKIIGKKRIKIITATREPISQNISALYQGMDNFLWYNDSYWANGGDVNSLFDFYITECKKMEKGEKNSLFYTSSNEEWYRTFLIQHYFEIQFQRNLGIDIFKYPFNKEQGYDIIKADGVEIFIYQLERLNDIYDKLFDFLGIIDGSELVSGNRAEDKYYSEYYKDAFQNIQFSQSYFDDCYNSQYVKHFYSEEDIERFKDRWRSHIFSSEK